MLNFLVDKKIEKDLQDYDENYRGRELPGFLSYRSFEDIVKEQIKLLEEPAIIRLKEISGVEHEPLYFHRFAFCVYIRIYYRK